jgi:adhesin transport system outer membrane protein
MSTLSRTVALYDNQANITWSFLELIKKKKAMGGEVNLLDILVANATTSPHQFQGHRGHRPHHRRLHLLYQMGQLRPEAVEN